MKYISLPQETMEGRPLPFYLAMEEYVARQVDEPDCFFSWRVAPTVICGRNQDVAAEVDMDYCRQHDVSVYRRKSGGGCVYADRGNIMLSYITKEASSALAFNRFIGMVLLVLHRLGIEATGTAHNDVMIAGRKVSGTACYHLPCGNVVHGTLLYDTDMENMLHAITPGAEKLQSKGIQSVRQRITLLKDHLPPTTVEELMASIRQTLCKGEILLTPADVGAIEEIEQEYHQSEFIQKMLHNEK